MKRPSLDFRRRRRGSLLALTLIVALLLTAVGASFISLTTASARVTEADFTERNVVYAAETGIDQAVATLNRYLAKCTADGDTWISPLPADAQKEWTGASTTLFGAGGWTATADGYRKDFGVLTMGNGREARLRVLVRNVPSPGQMSATPNIVAEVTYDPAGKLSSLGSGTFTKQYGVWLRRTSRYQNSVVGLNSVKLADNMKMNSYDSRLGAPAATNLGDKAVVATMSAKDGAVTGGNVSIYGYVVTGGDNPLDNLGAKGRVFGPGSPPPYAGPNGKGVDPNRLTRDFSGTFATPKAPASTSGLLDLNLLLQNLPVVDGIILLPAGSYRLSNPLNLPKTVTQVTQVVTTVTDTVVENVSTWVPLLGYILKPVTKTVTRDVLTTVTNEISISTIRVIGNVTIVVDGDPNAPASASPPISLSGNTQLILPIDSSLKIYTPGNVDLQGGGVLNGVLNLLTTTGKPENFMIYGTNTNTADGKRQSISVAGKGNFSGIIDAPNADVLLKTGTDNLTSTLLNLSGLGAGITTGSDGTFVDVNVGGLGVSLGLPSGNAGMYGFQGAVIGYNVTNDGNFTFHYDEALRVKMFPAFTLDSWLELKGANKVRMASFGF